MRISGTLTAALMGAVALTCVVGTDAATATPTWLPQVDATAGYSHATDAKVAVDGSGRVTVTTDAYSSDGQSSFNTVTVASRRVGDLAFGPEQVVGADSSWDPAIASNAGGLTAVAFQHDDDGRATVQVAIRLPGEAVFGPAVTVSGAGTSYVPQVVVSETGDVTVAMYWRDPDTFEQTVRTATRPSGSAVFGEPVDLFPPQLTGLSDPDIGVDASGAVTVAWSRGSLVEVSRKPPSSASWSTPLQVGDNDVADRVTLSVGLDGTTAVGWVAGAYPSYGPWLAVRQPGGDFQSQAAETQATRYVSEPQAMVLPNGAVAATWYRSAADGYDVRLLSPATGPLPVTLTTQAVRSDIQIGAGPDGTLTLVWENDSEQGYSHLVSLRVPTTGPLPQADVTPDQVNADEEDPDLVVDSNGDATVVFRDYDQERSQDHEEVTGTIVLDTSGPRIAWTAPGPGTVGVAVPLAVSAVDWSGTTSVSWDFGDGTTGTGASTAHVYGAPSAYAVRVTATDGSGNTTSEQRPLTVVAAAISGDTTSPHFTEARIRPRHLPVARPARLKVTSSETARLRGVVQRRHDGHWSDVTTRSWLLRPGKNNRLLFGQVKQLELAPGVYRLQAIANDRAGNKSPVLRIRFYVRD